MKKILLLLILAIMPSLAGAAELYLGNAGSNLSSVTPSHGGATYYKCQNSVTYSCQTTYLKISYTSQVGGSGTPLSPYILTGCSFISCACSYQQYLSGTTCRDCSNSIMLGAPDSSTPHVATSCQYCKKGFYGTSSCSQCPRSYWGSTYGDFGTTAAAGAKVVTECYLESGGAFADSTGKGEIVGDKCYYKN